MAAAVIERFSLFWKNQFRMCLVGGFMLFKLVFQIVWMQENGSWSYLKAESSAGEYLKEMNYDFRAIQYIQESLGPGEKVMFLWDGRNYYCDSRCVPDDEQSTAITWSFGSPPPATLARDLHKAGITHLLLSKPDANWFITYHDPNGLHEQALHYFEAEFFPSCGRLIYGDEAMSLFEITCRQDGSQAIWEPG
jgi:hypothetical protein